MPRADEGHVYDESPHLAPRMTTPTPSNDGPEREAQADPSATTLVRSLNAVIKALVLQYGEPQATIPPTVTLAISAASLATAHNTAMTIANTTSQVDPVPFILITVEGM